MTDSFTRTATVECTTCHAHFDAETNITAPTGTVGVSLTPCPRCGRSGRKVIETVECPECTALVTPADMTTDPQGLRICIPCADDLATA